MLQFLKKVNVTQNCHQKKYNKCSYQISLWIVVYHYHLQKFFGKIDNFVWKYSWYKKDLMFFLSLCNINIWYCFLLFVVTIIATGFHAQMFFNCSNSSLWMSMWYLSFVPSLNWDSASQLEIMKQYIPQNNNFQQMTRLQYQVY